MRKHLPITLLPLGAGGAILCPYATMCDAAQFVGLLLGVPRRAPRSRLQLKVWLPALLGARSGSCMSTLHAVDRLDRVEKEAGFAKMAPS